MVSMMNETKDNLVFFCNGKQVVESNPDPEMNLLYYLRKHLRLTGSKLSCSEGGCGACTVMVSSSTPTGHVTHRAVNACLVPVCSVHGTAVTTVEGIGSVKTKLHPVQERIAKAHGSQCGFCTPGMVMSMYALLRNNPQPTMEDIHSSLEGNLCRCTGYRPILEGFKTFTGDGCCGGKCMTDSNIRNGEQATDDENTAAVLFDESEFAEYEPTQDIIFPPELMLASSQPPQSLTFRGERVTWYRPTSLAEVLALKARFPDARLVAGNTEIGIEMRFGNQLYPVLICVTHVQELTDMEVNDDGIVVGSSVTLSRLEQFLKTLISDHPEHKTRVFSAIVEMLRWFAGAQIRNMAAVGGNIVTGSPVSDLNPIFMAAKCTVELVSQSHGSRFVTMNEDFFTGYRKNILMPDEILRSITIPFTRQNEYVFAFKQSPRREDDIAVVNAGMRVLFGVEAATPVIEDITLAFGGMAATTVLALQTMASLKRKSWDSNMLENALSALERDLPLPAGAPGGMETYRKSLTLSFFFKFYLMVLDQLSMCQPDLNVFLSSREKSATSLYQLLPVRGAQVYERVPSGQPSRDPVGRPIPHKAALQHATGEAVYVDDMPSVVGELYMSFVLSQRAHAKIISVDASSALALDGVLDFVSANDIPGIKKVGGPIVADEELFATEEVFHVGQRIGVVLAETQVLAQRAAKLVKVEYEDLESIITIQEAVEKQSFFGDAAVLQRGDPEEVFSTCDHVIEGELSIGGQEHFYLETQCALVVPKGEDSELEVFAAAQDPTAVQKMVAGVLDVPRNRITCRVKRLGGGFGGKEIKASIAASACAVAANKLQRPVRFMLEREDDIQTTGTRHPFLGRYRAGFTGDGKLQAVDIQLYLNAGFSVDLSPVVRHLAMHLFDNCYFMPVVRVEGHVCRTNLVSSTAFRGVGGPQAMLITESMITHVAYTCGISQEKVRELNFYQDGDMTPANQKIEKCTVRQCWEQCLENSDFYTRRANLDLFNRQNRWKKRGLAIIPVKFGVGFPLLHMNQGAALVHIYTDGSVLVTHGGVEMGQGLHTKMVQVAARTLGVPENRIHLSETSTGTTPNTLATAGSLSSDLNGGAIQNACQILRQRLEPFVYSNPKGTWDEWVAEAYTNRVSLSSTGYYKTPEVSYDLTTQKGKMWLYVCYGAGVSEVEIDCLTGDHRVLKTDIVFDVGQSINPAVDIGQIEGGFMQGYGLFVLEDLRWTPQGKLLTTGPGYYKVPGFGSIPAEFNVTLLKGVPNPANICSSKAIGEPPLFLGSTVFFAIKDAIKAARAEEGLTGNFRLDSPAVAERIRLACEDKFTKRFPEPEPATFQPFFVRP
ncbi:xanthine dehydrogenase/oxidase-like [Diadema antillarum]|uniref:xanthine dehydrogenase/oxidase-like n=1 Tax=Diadema antillarum TaxID=105358 RepID=UPI003A8B3179